MKDMDRLASEELSRELLLFLTVLYEQRNLSRTATRLSVSASKASRLLASARRVFGDDLYIRCGQGVTPTAKAHEITRQAKRVLEEMQRFFVEERFDPRKMNRVIRLVCVDNAIPIMIEPAIEKLFHDAPKAGLALIPHGERTILRMRAGEIDLAIFPAVNLPADFQCLPLLKTPYVNVVRAGHPLEAKLKKGEVKAADLKPYRRIQICVYPDTDDTSGGVPGAATIPMKAGKTMIWTESWLGAVRIMHRSDAVLTLPWRTAKVLAEEHPLVVLSQEKSVSWLEPALIWHEHMAADPGLQWVRSLIVTEIRGGLQPLVADEITLGRLGSAKPARFQV